MKQRCLYDLSQLVNLLLAAAHVAVRHVRFLFHLHHRDGGVDLRRQRDVDLVLIAVDAETKQSNI